MNQLFWQPIRCKSVHILWAFEFLFGFLVSPAWRLPAVNQLWGCRGLMHEVMCAQKMCAAIFYPQGSIYKNELFIKVCVNAHTLFYGVKMCGSRTKFLCGQYRTTKRQNSLNPWNVLTFRYLFQCFQPWASRLPACRFQVFSCFSPADSSWGRIH